MLHDARQHMSSTGIYRYLNASIDGYGSCREFGPPGMSHNGPFSCGYVIVALNLLHLQPGSEYLEVARQYALSNEQVFVVDEQFDDRAVVRVLLHEIRRDVLEHKVVQRSAPVPLT